MANERNIAALTVEVRRAWNEGFGVAITEADATAIAERLAARGVLVPSALTEAQASELAAGRGELPSEYHPEHTAWLVAELKRVAKGED